MKLQLIFILLDALTNFSRCLFPRKEKRKSAARVLCFTAVFFFAAVLPAGAEIVKHVIDGDTLILENEERVRLIGVDAPEVDHPKYNRIGERYGPEARSYLRRRVEGRDVELRPGPEPVDKYGRRLAYVWLDGVHINAELVRLGHAEAIRYFEYDLRDEFLAYEEIAKHEGLGLWAARPHAAGRENTGGLKPVLPLAAVLLVAPVIWLVWKRI